MAEDGKKPGEMRSPKSSRPTEGGRPTNARSGGGRPTNARSGSRRSPASRATAKRSGAPGTVRGAKSRTTSSGSARPTGAPGTVRGSNSRTAAGGGGGTRRPGGGTAGTGGPGRKRPNYALRRVIALSVLLAILALVAWAVVALVGIISDRLQSAETPTDSPTTTTPAAEPTPTALSTAAPLPCPAEDLTWTAFSTASAGTTTAGTPVTWELTFTNTSQLACTVDFGPHVVVQTVTSGEDTIWSSRHCGSETGTFLLLGPGDTTTRSQTWDGSRSQEGCTPVGASPQPGTYVVTTEYGGMPVAAVSETFHLVAAPEPPPPAVEEGVPADGEAPAEGEAPPDAPAEGEAPADGGAPAEGDAPPAEG